MHLTNLKYFCLIWTLIFAVHANAAENSEVEQMVQDAMICFTLNTAAKIFRLKESSPDKTFVFSPLDLYATTGLAYLGATGSSKAKLAAELGVPNLPVNPRSRRQTTAEQAIHTAIGELVKQSKAGSQSVVKTGTGVYVESDFAIKSTYIKDAKDFYGVDVKCADFCTNNVQATEEVNKYVKNATAEAIQPYFPKPVSSNTKSVFVSAFSMAYRWNKSFNPSDTYETEFHTRPDGCEDHKVCVMVSQQNIPIYRDNRVTAIDIPSKEKDIHFYIILPNEGCPLDDFINNPDKDLIVNIIQKSQVCEVRFIIPKIVRSETTDYLAALKLSQVQNVDVVDVADKLVISDFHHKVKLEINEEGVGGCPVTIPKDVEIITSKKSGVTQVNVNRPFLVMVYNSDAKTILYYGAIYNPTGNKD